MRTLLLLVSLALGAPALGASDEISLQYGLTTAPDASWEIFSKAPVMSRYGLRLGLELHPRITGLLGYSFLRNGRDWYEPDGTLAARAAFLGHELTLGAKADLPLTERLHPYVTLEGLVLQASWRFDDDPTTPDNLGQMRGSDTSYGLQGALGLEFLVPEAFEPIDVAVYAEGGYAWIGEMVVCPVGNLSARGGRVNAGVSLRF